MRVEHGDCLDVMRRLADEGVQVDSIVTDPPYHLISIVKRFGADGAAPAKSNGATGVYARASAGFMGKTWDGGDIANRPETWALARALLKPGGHLVAFGGTRTYHRMICAIEDAGFEVRDGLCWLYGTGFPKSHNIGDGKGTALKPAWEPITLARKPLAEPTVAGQMLATGTGALNIGATRIATDENLNGGAYAKTGGRVDLPGADRSASAAGMLAAGKTTGRDYEQPSGRWPANVAHDSSPEVLEAFAAFGESKSSAGLRGLQGRHDPGQGAEHNRLKGYTNSVRGHSDAGTAARFFYSAKASRTDRTGSKHPTVKPVSLMRWLVRMVTPPGGVVLDPFAGSGTTGQAAREEGFEAILIEREAEYVADIRRRLATAPRPQQEAML